MCSLSIVRRMSFAVLPVFFVAIMGTASAQSAFLPPSSSTTSSAGSPSASSTKTVHFEVIEHGRAASLSSSEFVATVAGAEVPVSLTKGTATAPTHLLLILQSGHGKPQLPKDVLHELEPEMKRGWKVSVVLADGSETPYASTQSQLIAAVGHGTDAGYNGQVALEELAAFAGRRVLIVVQPDQAFNPVMLAQARSLIPEIYRVDGGLLKSGTTITVSSAAGCAGFGGNIDCAPTPAAALPSTASKPVVVEDSRDYGSGRTPNGVLHEVDLKAAVKEALRDAGRYYDVVLQMPSSAAAQVPHLEFVSQDKVKGLIVTSPYLFEGGGKDGVKRMDIR
jgi:hypothetical protein